MYIEVEHGYVEVEVPYIEVERGYVEVEVPYIGVGKRYVCIQASLQYPRGRYTYRTLIHAGEGGRRTQQSRSM